MNTRQNEEIVTKLIDQLNKEKKPNTRFFHKDEEINQLLETVRAVKRLKNNQSSVSQYKKLKIFFSLYNTKKLISAVCILVLFLSIFYIVQSNNNSNPQSVYNSNPDTSSKIIGSDKFNAFRIPFSSIDELVTNSDLIVIGEVISDAKTVEKSFSPPTKSADKLNKRFNKADMTYKVAQTNVKIDKVLYGDTKLKEFIFNQLGEANNNDFQTKVKKGEKVLLALKKDESDGTYASVAFEDGVFDIDKNGKLLSFSRNMVMAKYDGVDVNVLEKDIKAKRKN